MMPTEEVIKSLAVDEKQLIKVIAGNLGIEEGRVSAVITLFAEECTVPFIARYRKEKTGGLDELQIRNIEHGFSGGKNLESRRIDIIRLIFEQGKLTETLYDNICRAATLAELEDIYLPFKRKKKTRGMIAVEKGLQTLADAMCELETEPLLAKAAEYVTVPAQAAAASNETVTETGEASTDTVSADAAAETAVTSVEDALQGAMDIIAEFVAQDPENRAHIKAFYLKDGKIMAKGSGKKGKGDDEAKKTSVYQMYWDYSEPLSQIKPHRILAINRAEREEVLSVTIDLDENAATEMLWKRYMFHNEYHKTAVEDGLKRLLTPALIREIRSDQGDAADDHGIGVFSENLRNLLLQQPIKGTRVLGIDPGIRTGTKCAFLDDTGKYLGNIVIYNHKVEESKKILLEGIRRYDVQLIAVGNGTGSREVQEIIASLIADNNLEALFTVVDEDGASVYSASYIAREEFPDLDLTIRGAISIGRRLQDPLAELTKIDPKSIGVGMYQHDVNQKKLCDTLDEVVSSVVNNVGVNLNTASASLLKYVSGINKSLAQKIVIYRNDKGSIGSRWELTTIPGMGPKSFEQCAGFLKIPESSDPLDNTWVHPENYPVAREILKTLAGTNETATITAGLCEKYGVGRSTILDIAEELKKPNRDLRDDYPKPIMRKGIVTFEDLHEGMTITGKIKNVVDFGAFVDLGIKETALVHISEMSNNFVKDPLKTVKVGDVAEFRIISLDTERRRIGLSGKSPEVKTASQASVAPHTKSPVPRDGKSPDIRKVSSKKNAAGKDPVGKPGRQPSGKPPVKPVQGAVQKSAQKPVQKTAQNVVANYIKSLDKKPERSFHNDDGTMYSPFADAFRKMQKK